MRIGRKYWLLPLMCLLYMHVHRIIVLYYSGNEKYVYMCVIIIILLTPWKEFVEFNYFMAWEQFIN